METPSITNSLAIALTSKEVLLCFFGIYGWEYCVSLWFEWKIATGYPFKWPLIPYFLARYSGLASLIANLVFVYPYKELNCQALQKSIVVFGNIGITAASGNLMIRAIIVWGYRRWVIAVLSTLFAGQWILAFIGLRAGATIWNPLAGACVPAEPQAKYVVLLGTFSIYTAVFDLMIAILTVLGVRKFERDGLASLLQRQGITYFALILVVHITTVALVFHDINSFLGIYGALAAVTFCPMIACRLVRAVFDTQSQSRRGTAKSSHFSSGGDTSRSSRSAPQGTTGVQLTTRVNLSQSETEDYEMQIPIEKRFGGRMSSSAGTIASNV